MRAFRRSRPTSTLAALVVVAAIAGSSALFAQQTQAPLSVFRASRDVVSIDVVVRDRSGALVRGLSARDFEIREDGRLQEILTSSFEEVDSTVVPAGPSTALQRLGFPPASNISAAVTPAEMSGRRMILLLFDLSAMEPDEVERGVLAALKYVDTQMSNADVVAVASLTWQLTVLTDFTGDRAAVREILESLVAVDTSTGDAPSTDPGTGAAADAGGALVPVAATDARLRALRFIADALAPITQKKALVYFTAGLGNSAHDTLIELRAATTAATKANLAIYPVDTRGLEAVVPSGTARVASRSDEGLFSGRSVNDQFTDLTASQDTLVSMASATGGRMFSGTNDVSAVFARVQRDTAAYYLLGYSSSNTVRDGRFRRVQVRVKREGLRIDARTGYYGDRDFAHTSTADREAELEEYLLRPTEPSALDVQADTAWLRLEASRFRVPLTITVAAARGGAAAPVEFDVLAIVEDEQGRALARLRDTVQVPPVADGTPSLVYTSSVVLPPGHFTLKAVVRERTDGVIGGTVTDIQLPVLSDQSLAVSAPLLRHTESDASPSLYVEVYDARTATAPSPPLVVSVAFFRDSVRVMQAALPAAIGAGVPATGATAYELPLAAGALAKGRYVCQVTVVDPVRGRFAATRADLHIH